ncbi:MAG TPA: reverse transcriptase family protein [Kofleriaceae bacterium]|jgi:hypothetical protein
MPSTDVLAHAIAAALLDGTWEPAAMRARIRATFGIDRPWMRKLAQAARAQYAIAPAAALGELAKWLRSQPAFHTVLRARPQIVHYALPAPAMAESPWPVPALATPRELSTWLGFELDTLDVLADPRPIADARARHYRYAWIAKPSGGQRLVEAPKWRLRTVQRRILDGIVDQIPPHDAAHGFRRGRSVATFAAPHVGREVVLRLDLQAFFSSVFAARVVGMLRTAGYPEAVSRMLAALCTHRTPADILAAAPFADRPRLRSAHLPQGAPTSGALANLAAYRLDVRIAGLARTLDATYTRYADDLVLSGDRALARAAPSVLARLAAIAADEGFTVNHKKTRVMTSGSRQRITGVVVNEKLAVPRAEVERLRAILHNCRRHGPASQNRDQHPDFRAHLRGRVAWIDSLDPAKGARLRVLLEQIGWDAP